VINKTSVLALRALLVIAREKPGSVIPPRTIAANLNESPAYMAKVLRLLVKAGILRAERGTKGGVFLNRPTSEISMLAIVQACQGAIVGGYCQEIPDLRSTCSFHRAAVELEQAVAQVLSRWNLAHLERIPAPVGRLPGTLHCLIAGFPAPLSSPARSAKGAVRR
jgi:Rrf2 family transcriptional regulator, nitric oxide-sensitive transcriptional repressor